MADIGWRDFFPDPVLQQLIASRWPTIATCASPCSNVQAAQAQYRIQRADLFPRIAANGVEQVEKYPADVLGTGAGEAQPDAR